MKFGAMHLPPCIQSVNTLRVLVETLGGAGAGGSGTFCDVAVQFDGPPLPLDSSRNLIRFLHKTIVLLLVFVGIQLLVAKTL